MKLKKGVLIVFEGIDGSGKTTQAQILLEKLEARDVEAVYFREPSDSPWGREIKSKALKEDSLTPQEELELFQKDRQVDVERNLKPALAENKAVILDRYYYSTIAYQGAKGIDPESIREINERFAVIPDLIFIFDVDPAEGLERIKDRKAKDLLFEREDYLTRVREIFLSFSGENITHLDARKPAGQIAGEIERIVFEYLESPVMTP